MSKLPQSYTVRCIGYGTATVWQAFRAGERVQAGVIYMSEPYAIAACIADQRRRVDPGPTSILQCIAGWDALKAYCSEHGIDSVATFAGAGGMPHISMMERIFIAMKAASDV